MLRKLLFLFAFVYFGVCHCGLYAQQTEIKFTHSLSYELGIYATASNQYNVSNQFNYTFNSARGLYNLLPIYELGINNTIFFKFKFRNLIDETEYKTYENGEWNFYFVKASPHYYGTCRTHANVFSLLISYNFLKNKTKHSLKWGISADCIYEIYYFNTTTDTYNHEPAYYDKPIKRTYFYGALGSELSYKYSIDSHYSVGASVNEFIHYNSQGSGLFGDLTLYGGVFLSASYTF
ncbi:MAG: hypothetical protein LBO06_02640 [Bacteroidales bacterium]|jgi:hypothetical protein|nr:hypothetical protein [Bacteroidales bacterium]